ncbi:hypothetical protein CAAN1_08S03048 [[Candida] anglica]|uniref:Spindle pole body component Bbp1 C-terminal domain-containing protein n=1 Tax=[Candida] anglica TaxID=148631 RepID=A0ABP0EA52_9ASCO
MTETTNHAAKGIFSRVYDGLFGAGDPLTNEPTIDYNNTFHNNNSTVDVNRRNSDYESTIDSTREFQMFSRAEPTGKEGASKPYRDLFERTHQDWYDDDLDRDLESIYKSHDNTAMKLDSLPNNYPGRFQEEWKQPPVHHTDRREQFSSRVVDHDDKTRSRHESYSHRELNNNNNNNNTNNKSSGISSRNSTNRQLEQLEREIDQDEQLRLALLNKRLNSKDDENIIKHKELESILTSIESKNEFLTELNQLIDLNNNKDLKSELEIKYNELYNEYTEELVKCNKFYEAYYKLAFQYRELRKEALVVKPSVDTTTLLENIKLIKSISTNPSIVAKCEIILHEVKKFKLKLTEQESKIDQLQLENIHLKQKCVNYQEELKLAQERIEKLERRHSLAASKH